MFWHTQKNRWGVVRVGAIAVGTYFGGPVGGAIGATVGSALDTTIQGGNRNEILSSAIDTGINSSVGLINSRLQTSVSGWQPSYYPNSQIAMPPAQQIFDNIVDQGSNTLKSEIASKIGKTYPPETETVPLINSILKDNFEQRKAKAVETITGMVSDLTSVPEDKISSAQNEQELRNIIVQFAQEHKLNSSAILYAMDYIL